MTKSIIANTSKHMMVKMAKGMRTKMAGDRVWAGALLILLCLFCLFFSSGCYGKRELDETGYVLAFGLDKGENGGVHLLAQVAIQPNLRFGPQSGGGGNVTVWNAESEGRTVYEAVKRLASRSPRRLFWSHSTAMVLTEELAKDGIVEVLDIITRERQFRQSIRVLVTSEDLKEIFSLKGKLEPVLAFYITDLENITDMQSQAPTTTMRELYDALYSTSPQPILARLSIWRGEEGGEAPRAAEDRKGGESEASNEEPKNEASEEGGPEERGREERKGGEDKGGGAKELPSEISITGSAAFRGDKFVGWLSADETKGVMWARGKSSKGATIIKAPGASGLISIRLHDSFASISVEVDEERIENSHVNINVAGDGDIVELLTEKRYLTVDDVEVIDRAYSNAVRNEIERAVEICQKQYGTDLFGIGEHFRRNMRTKRWKEIEKDWNQIFTKLRIDVSVDMRVRRRGMTLYAVDLVK